MLWPQRPSHGSPSTTAASPPPALAALPPPLWGAWPRPCLPRSLRGGAAPRESQRWLEKRQLKGQPPPCQLLQWGWKEGALQRSPAPYSPEMGSVAHSTPFALWCPGIQPPAFAHTVPPPGRSPSAMVIHVPSTRLNSMWTLRLSSESLLHGTFSDAPSHPLGLPQ